MSEIFFKTLQYLWNKLQKFQLVENHFTQFVEQTNIKKSFVCEDYHFLSLSERKRVHKLHSMIFVIERLQDISEVFILCNSTCVQDVHLD